MTVDAAGAMIVIAVAVVFPVVSVVLVAAVLLMLSGRGLG